MLDLDVYKKQGKFTIEAAFRSEVTGVTALFGRSGAGKTSIINMVAGLTQPDRGRIIVNEKVLFDSTRGINLPPEKRQIGYIFQDGRLFPHLSVKANLTYGTHRQRQTRQYADMDQVVALLGLEKLLSRRPARLSGGEKQRVAIGRALLSNPSLLLMDEPLASLDAERKTEVLPFIATLSQEFSIPILYVSHSLDEVLNLADMLVLMEEGHIMAKGDIETLMSRRDLSRMIGNLESCGAVLKTRIEAQDPTSLLSHLRFPGGVLRVPWIERPIGSPIRVLIPARNVAISLVRPSQTSIQNIFPGVVREIADNGGAFVTLTLDIGCPLHATITRFAASELAIHAGLSVFAQIKSGSVLGGLLWHEPADPQSRTAPNEL